MSFVVQLSPTAEADLERLFEFLLDRAETTEDLDRAQAAIEAIRSTAQHRLAITPFSFRKADQVRIQGVRDQATPRRRRDASAVINRNGRPARLRATDGYQPLSAALGNRLGGGVLSIQAMTA